MRRYSLFLDQYDKYLSNIPFAGVVFHRRLVAAPKFTIETLASRFRLLLTTIVLNHFHYSAESPSMDSHSSHLNAANRSRSSQTPSPSHSAAASVTSSLHKRKLAATTAANAAASEDHAPPSTSFPHSSFSADTRDGALTSNDELESISARGADSDSDPDESEDVVVDDDEDEFAPEPDQDSSIRTFTAARLDSSSGVNGSSRSNTQIKTERSTVKLESSDGKPSVIGTGTSGAYIAREETLKREEQAGRLKFVCYSNDCVDEHMMWYLLPSNRDARRDVEDEEEKEIEQPQKKRCIEEKPQEIVIDAVFDRDENAALDGGDSDSDGYLSEDSDFTNAVANGTEGKISGNEMSIQGNRKKTEEEAC
ncbi:unnamed protein product [Microthlaspi erraticum]|uniref:Uncharacterized protein n=1 Tax=Microthlaspi erraticum TaxID=1685480 RepID=A0A6D2K397_9BRAS|nr:unnamed protein product [Microthlaspi erraticum]